MGDLETTVERFPDFILFKALLHLLSHSALSRTHKLKIINYLHFKEEVTVTDFLRGQLNFPKVINKASSQPGILVQFLRFKFNVLFYYMTVLGDEVKRSSLIIKNASRSQGPSLGCPSPQAPALNNNAI